MNRADLHIHTVLSGDSTLQPEVSSSKQPPPASLPFLSPIMMASPAMRKATSWQRNMASSSCPASR